MPATRIEWTFAAKAALRSIHWRTAARVDEAVIRFASTGQGRLDRIASDPRGALLRVGRYTVRLELDPRQHLVRVIYVWSPDRA